jgi:hypothetical protein
MLSHTLKVQLIVFAFDERVLMTSGFSNGVNTEGSHDRDGHEKDDILSSLEKLLLDAEEVRELQRARSSVEHEMRRFDDFFEHSAQNDCAATP